MPIIKRPPSPSSRSGDRDTAANRAWEEDARDAGRRVKPRRRRPLWASALRWLFGLIVTVVILGALGVGYVLVFMVPRLPSLDVLTDYRPKVPLRIYTADHVLIGEFGEERRTVVPFKDIPDVMKKAVLAIEDYRFYEHGGVDFVGIGRAIVADLTHGGATQGASTITQQLARNFFLSSERTYTRKAYEMLLAYRIEQKLSKDQILELYMNQIYLGERAYGFSAAARVYFGKDLKDITLAEAAMLAGLPKAPSANNPVVNLKRAKERQEYILKRMLDLRYITQAQYDEALKEPIEPKTGGNEYSVHAEYVAEMARQMVYAQFHDETYTRGLTVITTINSTDQNAAYAALRKGILDYERRHGYRGPEGFVDLSAGEGEARANAIDDALAEHPDNGEIVSAVVTSASPKAVVAQLQDGSSVTVGSDGLRFVAAALSPRASAALRIRPGAIVRLVADAKGRWHITQLPQVEGALVSLTPQDGAIRALVGGFDFNKNKFNHVTQAWRQPGSSFKPFIYSASLEKGLAPSTIINDAPLYFPPASPGGQAWEPKDDDHPDGPMPMRLALQRSKNLVSIRILSFIGTQYAQQYVTQRFGFDVDKTPPYLPMALGAGLVTPLQSAGAYSVFANGGYRINPYLIAEVDDPRGQPLLKAQPLVAGQNAPRALSSGNAYIMNSLLHSVATAGTGAGTNVLGRSDLQGKTGTTNDAKDGWFAGYQRSLVTVAWMGYDQPRSLGSREFGAQLALPIWVQYMQQALRGVPESEPPMPSDVVTLNGELYLANMTPGNGFVASVDTGSAGVPGAPGSASAPDGASDASGATGSNGAEGMTPPSPPPPGVTPPTVTTDERQQILNQFGAGGGNGGSGGGQ